ncbi:MAG TPA: DUF1761 domain-containing protein [Actinomycetota bacterium]|jgi:hypothetical protein|nr:DUF1761 domain-containing protein [Actinomycetota bacterium]
MSLEMLQDVNFAAVAVAALAYFVLGAIWYIPPVMGNMWAKAGGIDTGDQSVNPLNFIGTYVSYFISGAATAMLAVASGTDSAEEGAMLGLVVGIGFALTAAGVTSIYDRKPDPLGWFLINGLFNTGGLVLVGVIIGAWR